MFNFTDFLPHNHQFLHLVPDAQPIYAAGQAADIHLKLFLLLLPLFQQFAVGRVKAYVNVLCTKVLADEIVVAGLYGNTHR